MLAFLQKISGGILKFEKVVLIFLAAAVTGLILLNVVTRSVDFALYWVDELAIYSMIWMVLIGASMIVRLRKGIAVTILEEMLSQSMKNRMALVVDFVILAFALVLLWMCYLWYDPATLVSVGFDLAEFSADSFNFIYEEPTNTLGIPKFWIWLIVPVVSLTMSVHALVNFLERLLHRTTTAPEII